MTETIYVCPKCGEETETPRECVISHHKYWCTSCEYSEPKSDWLKSEQSEPEQVDFTNKTREEFEAWATDKWITDGNVACKFVGWSEVTPSNFFRALTTHDDRPRIANYDRTWQIYQEPSEPTEVEQDKDFECPQCNQVQYNGNYCMGCGYVQGEPLSDTYVKYIESIITNFVAWMTTRDKSIAFGDRYDCAPVVEVIQEYMETLKPARIPQVGDVWEDGHGDKYVILRFRNDHMVGMYKTGTGILRIHSQRTSYFRKYLGTIDLGLLEPNGGKQG